MKEKRITTEEILYITAFLLALAVRLLRLGSAPLSDFEASWALQALDVARGNLSTMGSTPGYVFISGLSFFLFESTNTFARLIPALAGAALIWTPYLFRRPLGQTAGVIMAFGLAFDPGLVALSRLAGGPMVAIAFGSLALGFWYARKPFWTGICTALALLGGPALLQGFLGLALAWGLAKLLVRVGILDPLSNGFRINRSKKWLTIWLISFSITIVAVGTLFLRYPRGIGAIAETLPAHMNGWLYASGVPASRLIVALIFYQPLALIFGGIAIARAWIYRQNLARWLSIWFFTGLMLALLYQGRQVWDVAWTTVPLWALASIEFARHLRVFKRDRWVVFGEAVLIVVLSVIVWLNLAGVANLVGDGQYVRLRWVVILGALVLGVVTTILMALGWSSKAAQLGLVLGISISLGIYVFANMWSVSQVHPNGENELWSPPPYTKRMDSLVITLGDLSEWQTGFRNTMEAVAVSDSPSLRWALRDWSEAQFTTNTYVGELPPVILKSGEQSAPSETVAYRGQGFGLWVYPAWNGALPINWPEWLVFRKAPQYSEELILWARGDLFPDGSISMDSDTEPSSQIEEEEEQFEGPVE